MKFINNLNSRDDLLLIDAARTRWCTFKVQIAKSAHSRNPCPLIWLPAPGWMGKGVEANQTETDPRHLEPLTSHTRTAIVANLNYPFGKHNNNTEFSLSTATGRRNQLNRISHLTLQ